MKLSFAQYARYLKTSCDEELERMQEFLSAVEQEGKPGGVEDVSKGDKYYLEFPQSSCPPDRETAEKYLEGRDFEADLTILERNEATETPAQTEEREELYQHIRYLLLCS